MGLHTYLITLPCCNVKRTCCCYEPSWCPIPTCILWFGVAVGIWLPCAMIMAVSSTIEGQIIDIPPEGDPPFPVVVFNFVAFGYWMTVFYGSIIMFGFYFGHCKNYAWGRWTMFYSLFLLFLSFLGFIISLMISGPQAVRKELTKTGL